MARRGLMASRNPSPPPVRAVAAIDFGTSRSGFAYAFTADGRVIGSDEWPDQPTTYPKTATRLLYGTGRRLICWGWPADRRLAELKETGRTRGCELFGDLRPLVRQRSRRAARGPVVERGRRKFAVVDLVADYLRELRQLAWRRMRDSTAAELAAEEVRWCLTVPASFNDRHKELLRAAAKKAGLWSGRVRDAERLLLVPEPVAAAVHCQEKDLRTLGRGSRFLVVDCGDATVDVTAYEVAGTRRLRPRALAPAAGAELGSIRVDEAFVERFLARKLGPDLVEAYRREEPLDFLETMAEWERIKCNFDPETSVGPSRLVFRPRLLRLLAGRFSEIYEKLRAEGHEDGLWIEPSQLRALFMPVLGGITGMIRAQLAAIGHPRPEVLYLVGGFASSPLLVRRITNDLRSAVGRIVVPPVPAAAVVEGAVSYGLEPTIVRTRRSRLTYGCVSDMVFDPGVDPPSRRLRYTDLDEPYCRERLCCFVAAGDEVDVDQRVTHVFSPMTRVQTELVLDLYASSRRDVRYTDEDGVEKVADLVIRLPDNGDCDREVELVMSFGQTEIQVEAVERTSGKRRRTVLQFSPSVEPKAVGDSP